MEMVMNNGFKMLSEEENYMIDGGLDLVDAAGSLVCGYAGKTVGQKVGSLIGGSVGGPIGAVGGGIIGVAAFEVVYHLNN